MELFVFIICVAMSVFTIGLTIAGLWLDKPFGKLLMLMVIGVTFGVFAYLIYPMVHIDESVRSRALLLSITVGSLTPFFAALGTMFKYRRLYEEERDKNKKLRNKSPT